MQLNNFNIFKVNTLEEFKELEQNLFSMEVDNNTNVTVICIENNMIYYYKSDFVLGKWRLVTNGEHECKG